MEILIIVSVLISLVVLYFMFGAVVKFLLGWFPIILALLVGGVAVIAGGVAGIVFAGIILVAAILITNSWQGCERFLKLEERIDQRFFFKD